MCYAPEYAILIKCAQDYMTPEQYQVLFFSYEQFKQLNFYREGSRTGCVSFVVVVNNLIVLWLFFPQMSIGQDNVVLSSHKILYWLQNTGGTVLIFVVANTVQIMLIIS